MNHDLNRRQFIKTAAGGCLAAMLPGLAPGQSAPAPSASSPRPNIIVILCDDMGFSDIGCYGGEIPTPNLDALASGGLRFTQFYNTARCCPTRASLLTGLYPHQAQVGHMVDSRGRHPGLDGYVGEMSRDAVTIAEALKPAGYGTYAIGKWHVTPFDNMPSGNIAAKLPATPPDTHNWPLQRGFDHYYGIIAGASNYFDPCTLVRDNTPILAAADPEYKPAQYYLTDAISDHAVKYMGEHARRQAASPFFMYVAYTAAHWPLHAPEDEVAKFKGKYDTGYEPVRKARFEKERALGVIDKSWDLSELAGNWATVQNKKWEARCMEVYAAQVSRMDQGVGKIVEALKKNGQFENTLILFLQDNGACAETNGRPGPNAKAVPSMPGGRNTWIAYGQAWANVSNTPFRYYKHFVHEGGISTPLIAHWPAGIRRRNELDHQPGHIIDLMATCVDLAGAQYPASYQGHPVQPREGISLAPAFAGKPLSRPNALFWEHEGNRAIRDGKWKLVARGPRGAWELYNLESDRTEIHNLAAQMPDKVQSMIALWESYAKRTHAIPWPYAGPYAAPGYPKPAAAGAGE